jgi:hypothetical protein
VLKRIVKYYILFISASWEKWARYLVRLNRLLAFVYPYTVPYRYTVTVGLMRVQYTGICLICPVFYKWK